MSRSYLWTTAAFCSATYRIVLGKIRWSEPKLLLNFCYDIKAAVKHYCVIYLSQYPFFCIILVWRLWIQSFFYWSKMEWHPGTNIHTKEAVEVLGNVKQTAVTPFQLAAVVKALQSMCIVPSFAEDSLGCLTFWVLEST